MEAAVWAALPLGLVNLAALVLYTCVAFVVLDGALEEALRREPIKTSTRLTPAMRW